jgi:hypothetical protein
VRYGVWLYPWDLLDFGPDRIANDLSAMDMTDVCLAVSYHSGRVLLPDNPRRTFFDAPEAAVYFVPDKQLWTGRPLPPTVAPLVADQGDAVAVARTMTMRTSLRLIGWTVCLHDSALPLREPVTAVHDVWGGRSPVSVCVANPTTRRYALALVADAAARVDVVQLEAAHWLVPHAVHQKTDTTQPSVFRRLSAYCVCQHCQNRVEAEGGDSMRLVADLRGIARQVVEEFDRRTVAEVDVDSYLADSVRDFGPFVRARSGAVTSLVAELQAAAAATPIEFVSYGDRAIAGVELRAIEQLGVDVRVLAYGAPDVVGRSLEQLKAASDAPHAFGVGLSALPAEAPDRASLHAAHDVAAAEGATSITYYNYGLLNARRRSWLRR